MKKLVLTSVFSVALAGLALAQGNVNWTGPSFSYFTAQTNSTTYFGGGSTGSGAVGSTATTALGFYYELLDSSTYQAPKPTSISALSSWADTGLGATNSVTSAGRASVTVVNQGAQVSWSPGTTNSIIMVGWSANLGTTWSAALATLNSQSLLSAVVGNAFFGSSNVGYITTSSTVTVPGASVFGSANTVQGTPINSTLTQLYIVPVPEPSTLALAALSGASLLLFRRRK
jgi:hypothetical protein